MKVLVVMVTVIFAIITQVSVGIAETVTVHGTVHDTHGGVIPGALVRIQSLSTDDEYSGTTAQDGSYTVEVFLSPSTGAENTPLPQEVILYPNYPNPFNPSTIITFDLERTGRARLDIFNILGQRVVTLADDVSPAGRHRLTWDGLDESGMNAGAGVYIARLQSGQSIKVRKMLLLDSGRPAAAAKIALQLGVYPEQPAMPDSLFRITVTKAGHLINGCEPFVLSPYQVSVEQDFTLKVLDMSCALIYINSINWNWLYILNPLDGSEQIHLPASNAVRGTSFSPDGTYLIYYEGNTDKLTCLNLDTNQSAVLIQSFHPGNKAAEWTPDGSMIIFYESLGGKSYTMNPNGTNIQEAPDFFGYKKYYLADKFSFLFFEGTGVFISDLNGAEPELLFDVNSLFDEPVRFNTAHTAFNPLTNALVINVVINDEYYPYSINVLTGDKKLIHNGLGRRVCFSPDNRLLAFVNDEKKIVVMDAENYSILHEFYVQLGAYELISELEFSPQGGYISLVISYVYSYQVLSILDTDSGHIVRIDGRSAFKPVWNPRFPY